MKDWRLRILEYKSKFSKNNNLLRITALMNTIKKT